MHSVEAAKEGPGATSRRVVRDAVTGDRATPHPPFLDWNHFQRERLRCQAGERELPEQLGPPEEVGPPQVCSGTQASSHSSSSEKD